MKLIRFCFSGVLVLLLAGCFCCPYAFAVESNENIVNEENNSTTDNSNSSNGANEDTIRVDSTGNTSTTTLSHSQGKEESIILQPQGSQAQQANQNRMEQDFSRFVITGIVVLGGCFLLLIAGPRLGRQNEEELKELSDAVEQAYAREEAYRNARIAQREAEEAEHNRKVAERFASLSHRSATQHSSYYMLKKRKAKKRKPNDKDIQQ